MKTLVLLYVIVMGAVHADNAGSKQKRGLLGQGLHAPALQSQAASSAYHYPAPAANLPLASHNSYDGHASGASANVQVENYPSVSYLTQGYNQLSSDNAVNTEVSAPQAQLNTASLNNYGANSYASNSYAPNSYAPNSYAPNSYATNSYAANSYAAPVEVGASQYNLNGGDLAGSLSGQVGGGYVNVGNLVGPTQTVHNVAVQVPVDRPYPVPVPRPVHIRIPVRIEHPVQVPVHYPVNRPVTVQVPVPVDRPVPVNVYKPYPVPKPYPVAVPVHQQKHVHVHSQTVEAGPGPVLLNNNNNVGVLGGSGAGAALGSSGGLSYGSLNLGSLNLGGIGQSLGFGGHQQPTVIVKHIDLTNHGRGYANAHSHSHGWNAAPVSNSW